MGVLVATKDRKRDLALLVLAEKDTLPPGRRRRLYLSATTPVERVEKQIGRREMLFGGDGRFHLPGMRRSRLFRKPPQIQERKPSTAPTMEQIVTKTFELSSLTKVQVFERLEALGQTRGLDSKESSKIDLVKALAIAELLSGIVGVASETTSEVAESQGELAERPSDALEDEKHA